MMYRLTEEVREELLNIAIIFGINLIFVGLITLALWPLGHLALAGSLANGYLVLWLALLISMPVVFTIERLLRIDSYRNFNAYVSLILGASGLLVGGWSAFAAVTITNLPAGDPVWLSAILYGVGFLSSYIAYSVITAIYHGTIYKLVNLPLALITYLVFAFWPVAGWAIYGWFFAFFGVAPG
jgi:hypothetical protein